MAEEMAKQFAAIRHLVEEQARVLQQQQQQMRTYEQRSMLQHDQLREQAGALEAQALQLGVRRPDADPPARTLMKGRKFSARKEDEWYVFRRQFEELMATNRYNDREARTALFLSMDGAAATAVVDIDPGRRNYDITDMLNEYESVFLSAPASELARIEFDQASQRDKETDVHWHGRLRVLGNRARPNGPGLEDELIRKFYIGLRNPDMREQVYRAHPATYTLALGAAHAERAVVIMKAATRSGANPLLRNHADAMEVDSLLGAVMDPTKLTCFRCGEKGHFRRNCQATPKMADLHHAQREKAFANAGPRQDNAGGHTGRPDRRGRQTLIAALHKALSEAGEIEGEQDPPSHAGPEEEETTPAPEHGDEEEDFY